MKTKTKNNQPQPQPQAQPQAAKPSKITIAQQQLKRIPQQVTQESLPLYKSPNATTPVSDSITTYISS